MNNKEASTVILEMIDNLKYDMETYPENMDVYSRKLNALNTAIKSMDNGKAE